MSKTYRVRTQVGVDRQINLQIDQDFEQIEILSLKVTSEDVYTRMCADYGIIVGRVFANNGYGIPNARISVFLPLSEIDQQSEIISSLYPYTSIEDVNEDGYRYNLLPYEQQHGGHVPTGTFPSRSDVLTNPALIEVYDKYYKFTVKTNDSGDYMIMGVPIGTYTLVMDLDLSDIGPFSLSPQDLVRIGRATPEQLDGVNFRADADLSSLPQIVSLNQSVDVEPFWGQPEICQIGISRHDFNLGEEGITLSPTAIFMGSLFTGNADKALKKSCQVPTELGNLCDLETGPGEIIGIRQTIFQDTNGLPILERATLPSGGKVIDENGVWVMDVPMNMDYVTTNEFGEQVYSSDPTVGVPTKGRYRFKIKYNQPQSLATNEVRRGYFLVPNVKEYGWSTSDIDPIYSLNVASTSFRNLKSSYYFGLDWSGYTNGFTGSELTNRRQEITNCEDTFYEFSFNKVYTVASHIDQYSNSVGRQRFIGVKEITDQECASENNRFPTVDAVNQRNLLTTIITIYLLPILFRLVQVILPLVHVLALIFQPVVWVINLFRRFDNQFSNPFRKITLPMLTFPDCETCDCSVDDVELSPESEQFQNSTSLNADFFTFSNWNVDQVYQGTFAGYGATTGNNFDLPPTYSQKVPVTRFDGNDMDFINNLPPWEVVNKFNLKSKYFDTDKYPGSNRIKVQIEPTLNPTQSHYDNVMVSFVDPGSDRYVPSGQLIGFQEITKSKDPNCTGATLPNSTTTGVSGTSTPGQAITINFANPTNPSVSQSVVYNFSSNPSVTKNYNFPSDIEYFQVLTAMTYTQFVQLNAVNTSQPSSCNCIKYVIKNDDGQPNNLSVVYTDCLGNTTSTSIGYTYDPTTGDYIGDTDEVCACGVPNLTGGGNIVFQSPCSTPLNPSSILQQSLLNQLNQTIKLFKKDGKSGAQVYSNYLSRWVGGDIMMVFMVRGVDPYSGRKKIKYDLSRIFGFNTTNAGWGHRVVEGDFYVNVPVQPGLKTVRHNQINSNLNTYNGSYLYFPSYQYVAGNGYSSYTSNLQSYYSALDSSQTNVFIPDSNFTPSQLNNSLVSTGPSGELLVKSNTPVISPSPYRGVGYINNEYVEGGTMIGYVNRSNIVQVGNTPTTVQSPNNDDNNNLTPFYYYSPSWARFVPSTMSVQKQRLVMRSDRLPVGTVQDVNGNNFFAWQSSNSLPWVLFSDTGTSATIIPQDSFAFYDNANSQDITTGQTVNKVIQSFDCNGMVALGCYQGYGQGFTVLPADNPCNTNTNFIKTLPVVKNGCYSLVNFPIATLNPLLPNNDWALLFQWFQRYRFMTAVCNGAINHSFMNSWVNGSLFAFPFKNNAFFDAQNRPQTRRIDSGEVKFSYCANLLYFDSDTSNFYYRSSPYNNNTNKFIGKDAPGNSALNLNNKNLLFPTTVLDLGPKFSWSKDVIKSIDYFGYQMDNIPSTSYNDVSDLTSLFIISRLANSKTFTLGTLLDLTIAGLFSRAGLYQRVDGDYAQSIQVNSQYGITPFSAENYPDTGSVSTNPIYVGASVPTGEALFGVFFSGQTEARDLISPRRIDRNITGPVLIADYLGTKSQEIPFYKWQNQAWRPTFPQNNIFGDGQNGWYTDYSIAEGGFQTELYQNFDRLSFPLFQGNNSLIQNRRGYIFQGNNSGGYVPSINGTSSQNYRTLVSAPWYFYFGLKNGKTAMDKYTELYVQLPE